MTRRTATRIGALVAIVAVAATAWAVLAPPELGGSTRYVILEGSSMEPALQAGDLALVRAQESVQKGDVVLYEHPRLGAHVLHRIVRFSGGRFTLKGDNNDYLDDVRPPHDEIEGKLWVTLPGVGSAIVWAREPVHAALIVFALAFFALGGGAAVAALRRSSRTSGPARISRQEQRSAGSSGLAQVLLAVGLAGVAVAAILAVVSYSRSTMHSQSVADAYAHVGTFSYGAEVEPSDVYPDGLVDTGKAVFTSLVPAHDVAFSYRLRASGASAVRGTTELTAVLSDGLGWAREIPLSAPTEFTGATATASGSLDLAELTRIVEEMKALTGSGTSTFGLRLDANVQMAGQISGERVTQTFSPTLPLLLDTVSLHPDSSGGSPFTVRRPEALTVDVPAALVLGGLRLSVAEARRAALLGLVLAALVAVAGGLAFRLTRSAGEPSHIASLFGDRLITISSPPSVDPARVKELRDAESLQRLAEHHQRIVLHWREGRAHVYEVDDGGIVYRYRAGVGVEPGLGAAGEDDDTLVMASTKLPPRAATG
jgi:signal peptidase I